MSYVSLLKNIPEILSQPTGIAAIASVGIHGAIALIVPLMPVDPNKPKETASSKSVGILELSQADQNRLPQTPGTPQFAVQPQLPRFPQQQQLALQPQVPPSNLGGQTTVLPPLPPSSYTQPVLPSLPTASNNYRISSLPTRQSPQLPKQDFKFDDSGFKVGSQKFTSSIPNFENKPVIPATSQPLPVERLPDLPPAKIPPELLNSPIPSPAPSSSITTANSRITPQPTQPDNNVSVPQNQTTETGIAQTPKAGDNATLSTASLPTSRQTNTTNLPNLPTKAPNQTLISQVQSYEELRKALQQQYPNSEEKAVIRDTVSVSKAGVEGTVLGFLVVDPDGKVLDIKFQDKLLSPALQLKARQYFNSNAKSLKGEKAISRYPFSLRFQDSSKTAGDIPQPTRTPSATSQPLSEPEINSQPVTIPAGNSSQITPTPVGTSQKLLTPSTNNVQPIPSSTSATNSNQLSSSQKPDRQLIQKLRDFQEKRETPKEER